MENTINEFYDNRNLQRNNEEDDNIKQKQLVDFFGSEEKARRIRLFLEEKNKNKRKPTQEEVLAEMNSLRGKYYEDVNGNFLLKNGRDTYD